MTIKTQLQLLALPLLVGVFLINHHYYGFYEDDGQKTIAAVKPSFSRDQYGQIERYHPYYQIYQLSQTISDPEKKLIYIRTKNDPDNKQYLHELTIMLNYFFYPRLIQPHSLNDLLPLRPKPSQIIISDYDLSILGIKSFGLKPLIVKQKDLQRINRRKEDDFFVYQVE